MPDIIDETEKLKSSGFKEVVLAGIHVASYGKDLGDTRLDSVIKEISKVDGIERIRLSSVEPNLITGEFMDVLVSSNKVCDHFHLSLQSGSDKTLKKMNRKYTRDEYREKVELIRSYMPNAGITTDIIVGFPGESDEDFEETLEFVKDIEFSKIHVFKYSPRKGTPAAKFENQVHGIVKNNRSERLIGLADDLMEKFYDKHIGSTMKVLFEEANDDGYYEGYTTNYIRVKAYSDKDIIGQLLDVDIMNYEGEKLVGKIGR